jgi:hypothetical protein
MAKISARESVLSEALRIKDEWRDEVEILGAIPLDAPARNVMRVS